MTIPAEEESFEYVPKSRQIANEIAEEKIYGWQPFTGEQIEKVREPVRKTLVRGGAATLGATSDVIKFLATLAQVPEGARNKLPSTENFKKYLEELTGESLQPSNFGEEVAGNIAERVGTVAGLGGARTAASAFLVPVAGETVRQTLKAGGAPEWLQTGATLLTDLFLGSRGSPSPREAARISHREADRLIPATDSIDGTRLLNEMNKIRTDLTRGGTSPAKTAALTKTQEIIDTINRNGGRMPAKEAFAFRTSVNDITGDPTLLQGAKRYLSAINRSMNRELDVYGLQNPKAIEALREGDRLVQGLANSRKATEFLRAKAPTDLRNPVSWLAFGLNPKTYLTSVGLTKAAEMTHRIITSPELRKHYFNTVKYSLTGDGKAAIHEMRKFDEAAARAFPELEEGEFEFIPKNQSSEKPAPKK
jgi:hypothetical protein